MAQGDLITPPTFRVVAAKPKMTIYYALLIIALCAMLTACLILYLEIRRFGGFGTVKGSLASVAQPAFLFHHGEHGVHGDDYSQFSSVNSVHSVVNS